MNEGLAHPEETARREWLRGVLDLCVLGVLARGPLHGYGIARALEEAGLPTVKGGTLYPLLARLEAAGWVLPSWEHGEAGPARKRYALTGSGQRHLGSAGTQWVAFATRATALLTQHDQPVA